MIMKDLNEFFESVYRESFLKLTEIEASTMSSLIRKHMTTEKDALAYARELGEKVAKNYDRTPLHPRTSVVKNAQLDGKTTVFEMKAAAEKEIKERKQEVQNV